MIGIVYWISHLRLISKPNYFIVSIWLFGVYNTWRLQELRKYGHAKDYSEIKTCPQKYEIWKKVFCSRNSGIHCCFFNTTTSIVMLVADSKRYLLYIELPVCIGARYPFRLSWTFFMYVVVISWKIMLTLKPW